MVTQTSPKKSIIELRKETAPNLGLKDQSLQLFPDDGEFGVLKGMDTKQYDYSIDFEDYVL